MLKVRFTCSADPTGWDWCLGESDVMIEGIQVPGGVLLSPIEITAAPLPIKVLQERYYKVPP